ncbi:MAG: hypothetical protein U1F68_05790 [Gammaproteobacteria bacterium]
MSVGVGTAAGVCFITVLKPTSSIKWSASWVTLGAVHNFWFGSGKGEARQCLRLIRGAL